MSVSTRSLMTQRPALRARVPQAQRPSRRGVQARYKLDTHPALRTAPLISEDTIVQLEAELEAGASMQALRGFNAALRALDATNWRTALTPVLAELCFNLESFNPAFAHVVLMVQRTIGHSDYERRDDALARLIVPLAGEYGMHNGEAQGQTHRALFDSWVRSMLGVSAKALIATGAEPVHGKALFEAMSRDIGGGGGAPGCPLTHASYAMGYNLAIEFMADYEKRWMLESFRELDARFMAAQGREVDWVFLEVHAEDEMEHAALGHEAVRAFVPEQLAPTVRRAMRDHDRDFAVFYNAMAAMLERGAAQ